MERRQKRGRGMKLKFRKSNRSDRRWTPCTLHRFLQIQTTQQSSIVRWNRPCVTGCVFVTKTRVAKENNSHKANLLIGLYTMRKWPNFLEKIAWLLGKKNFLEVLPHKGYLLKRNACKMQYNCEIFIFISWKIVKAILTHVFGLSYKKL